MNGTFTKIAALSAALFIGAGSSLLAPAARGDGASSAVYVPAPQYRGYGRDLSGLQAGASQFNRDVDLMYDVVSSYGGDNYARLRRNVDDLRGSAESLQNAIDRGDTYGIDTAFSSVQRDMSDTDYRMNHVQTMTRQINDAWWRLNNSFRILQDGMR